MSVKAGWQFIHCHTVNAGRSFVLRHLLYCIMDVHEGNQQATQFGVWICRRTITFRKASAAFFTFVSDIAASSTVEIPRDKPSFLSRFPACCTDEGRIAFWIHCFMPACPLLLSAIRFLFVRPRSRYCFLSPTPRDVKLASRYRVRRQLRPLGLSPKNDDMPVIQKRMSFDILIVLSYAGFEPATHALKGRCSTS